MNRFLPLIGLLLLACTSPIEPPQEQEEDQPVSAVEQVGEDDEIDGVQVSFTEFTGTLANPERGHYRARDVFRSSDVLKSSEVKAQRADGYTLWYLGFYLDKFMSGDISDTFLGYIQSCFDALRSGGAKGIIRFAYSDSYEEGTSMAKEDAPVDVVMRHVEQIKPILQKNEDVLFVFQAGFVGTWGEWYYTPHFVYRPSSDADFQPRKKLTEALLDAVPASRQIELRTPQFKMRMYGLSVRDSLTAATAHDGSARSRLGGHNDCFGASVDDYGTFDQEEKDREFWKADSRYTIMGGETCNKSSYCSCSASQRDLKDYHWTYLNKDYNSDVLDGWNKSGCYDEIVRRLGYRLVLKDVHYDKDIEAGKPCTVTLRFYNKGYAAPMNPRDAILVWVTPSGKQEETFLSEDPRTWHPGYHGIKTSFTPSTSKGTLYLKLSDPLLRDRPEYSIAFANKNSFNSSTGLNKLFEVK